MYREAAQSADVVQEQLSSNQALVERLGEKLRMLAPRMVITCARGSSDHACTYGKYLIEKTAGVFTTSAAPSILSVYDCKMDLSASVCIMVSQSGASPDLLAFARAAKKGGALVIALVNVVDSPLASIADEVIPLHAGPETSVAATKSFIASLTALAHLSSAWQQDQALLSALENAPALLDEAWHCDWSAALEPISKHKSLFVLGRGIGLGVAQEAALKFKEVCSIHAEAFSSAEVLHGPIAIANNGFPILTLAQSDETMSGVEALLSDLSQRDVSLFSAGTKSPHGVQLPTPKGHPAIEPMTRILSFYRLVNDLSLKLKLNPDEPPYLQKVTATI